MADENKEVCRSFRNTGRCRYGDDCKFDHTGGDPIQAPSRPRGPCFNFNENQECQFGDRCRFTHGEDDSRYSGDITQEICRNFQRGKCVFGDECQRQHIEREDNGETETSSPAICYDFRDNGECSRGEDCRFSHDAEAPDDAGTRRRRRRRRKKSGTADDNRRVTADDGEGGDRAPRERKKRKPKKKKSQDCFNFSENQTCEYGDECRFRHGEDDTRPAFQGQEEEAKDGDNDEDEEPRRARKPRRRKPRELVKLDEECRNYALGRCRLGENCRRTHVGDVAQEPQEKIDEVCNNFREGRCRYGEYCRRQHVDEPEETNA